MQSLFCCPAKVDYILMVQNKSLRGRTNTWFLDKSSDGTEGFTSQTLPKSNGKKNRKNKNKNSTAGLGELFLNNPNYGCLQGGSSHIRGNRRFYSERERAGGREREGEGGREGRREGDRGGPVQYCGPNNLKVMFSEWRASFVQYGCTEELHLSTSYVLHWCSCPRWQTGLTGTHGPDGVQGILGALEEYWASFLKVEKHLI